MARNHESPYPANAVFGVHVGYRPGAYEEYKDFLAQTEGFSENKLAWAVFTDIRHATEYARTGRCPVPPLEEKKAGAITSAPGSARSLPTPDASPETENPPPGLPTRQRPAASAPLAASASQPPPAPRKPQAVQPDSDSDGDTEPEEEFKPASSSLPAPRTTGTPGNGPPRRPIKSGSITSLLKRHASMNGGIIPGAQTPSPTKNIVPAPSESVPPSTAPATSGPAPRRKSHPGPSTASGSGSRAAPPASAPAQVPTPTPAPVPVAMPAPAPPPVPELPRQPRPHGTYEQCHHCDGRGWIFTPAPPTNTMPPPQSTVAQTPSRPRAAPTTNLRLLSTSDSESASASAASRIRTPSGSRLRVSSIGGVGPERTPKRDPKRTVSDSVAGRRMRIVSDSLKDKGKGKGRATELMDVDASEPEAGPSAYNYL